MECSLDAGGLPFVWLKRRETAAKASSCWKRFVTARFPTRMTTSALKGALDCDPRVARRPGS